MSAERLELLVEVGCEEIPDRFLAGALTEIGRRFEALFAEAGLACEGLSTCGTPRRLGVRVQAVERRQADRDEQVVGPPVRAAFDAEGQPTKAAIGFARKCGVEVAELSRVEDPKGERVAATRHLPGRSVEELLSERLPDLFATLPWPKNMRWGEGLYQWVRPVHWIVALAGAELIPVELFGISSGRSSRGHRTLAGGPIEIPSPSAYLETLRGVSVVADGQERRASIATGIAREAAAAGGRVVPDPELVELTADLVEWPVVVTGRFPEAYLELPEVVIRTAMRDHQRYFAVVDDAGALLPVFLHVAGQEDPEGSIAANNSSVLLARLDDARFVWDKDLQRPLADRASELERVLFQEKLGSYADKVARMRSLAERLLASPAAAAADGAALLRAVELCKVDLTTDMVKEFTSLQGRMGGLYLRREGLEAEATCQAVEEHYLPSFQGDALPGSLEGALLAVIDRIDTLSGCFGAGIVPSGSKDPFALRRAAQGLISVLAGCELAIPLAELLDAAADTHQSRAGFDRERAVPELSSYLEDRIRFVLGLTHPSDEIEAALGSAWSDLPGLVRRVEALSAVRQAERREDFEALSVAFKRVRNILKEQDCGVLDWSALREPAEKALAEKLRPLVASVRAQAARGELLAALESLAALRPEVDAFFEQVHVMDPDAGIRRNRLALLREIETLFLETADISQIVVPGTA